MLHCTTPRLFGYTRFINAFGRGPSAFFAKSAYEAICVKISVRRMISRKSYSMIPLCANTQFWVVLSLAGMSD